MKTCYFDVNGTLVNTALLDRVFAEIFDEDVRPYWLLRTLHQTLVLNETDGYEKFSSVGEAMLDAIAEEKEKMIAKEYRAEFKKLMQELPAFPDVHAGLKILKDHGFVLKTLSNSSKDAQQTVLKNADILDFFDELLTTDKVRKFKPAPQAYILADEGAWMIAAHAWDTDGAAHAGLKTALIKREESGYTKLSHRPDVEGKTLEDVVQQIVDHANVIKRTEHAIKNAFQKEKKPETNP